MSEAIAADPLPILSLDEQARLNRESDAALRSLSEELERLWMQSGRGAPVMVEGNPRVHELVIACALKRYENEWKPYAERKPQGEAKAKWAKELANRIFRDSCPPAVYSCGLSLAPLRDDPIFLKRFRQALQQRVETIIGIQNAAGRAGGRAPEIINRFAKKHELSEAGIAKLARIDPSVLRAIKRGVKKCSNEALERLAGVLHCTVEDLKPRGGWRETKRDKKRERKRA